MHQTGIEKEMDQTGIEKEVHQTFNAQVNPSTQSWLKRYKDRIWGPAVGLNYIYKFLKFRLTICYQKQKNVL